jgi:hypothetical protein
MTVRRVCNEDLLCELAGVCACDSIGFFRVSSSRNAQYCVSARRIRTNEKIARKCFDSTTGKQLRIIWAYTQHIMLVKHWRYAQKDENTLVTVFKKKMDK